MAAAILNKYAIGNNGGRPATFETPEALVAACDSQLNAQKLSWEESVSFLKPDFINERALADYLEFNLCVFCEQCLGYTYESHIREARIEKVKMRRNSHRRIDFLIKTKCGKIIVVECKNACYTNETIAGLGQILHYSQLLKNHQGAEPDLLVIVTSKIDPEIYQTIERFKLPIKLIGLDKTHHLIFQPFTEN